MADLVKCSQVIIQVEFNVPSDIRVSHLLVQVEHSAIAQVETPVILPITGAYPASQLISMSCATSGASIYYTEDGSTPDSGDSLYSAPFTLGSAKTIKAIGIKAGLTDSSVVTESYTIAVDVSLDKSLPDLQISAFSGASGISILSVLQIESYGGATSNVTLPELQVEIRTGSNCIVTLPELQIDIPEFVLGYTNVNLPSLAIEAYEDTSIKIKSGEFPTYALTLPEFRIEAAFGEVLTLNEKFPTLEIAAYSGIVSNDLTLPDLFLTSNVIETVVVEDILATATCLLPPLLITTESLTGSFDFDLTFPSLLVQANLSSPVNITLDKILSELRIDATQYGNSLTLDELLPAIIMRPLGYGDDSGSTISTLIESGRFDDILLRYDRWSI